MKTFKMLFALSMVLAFISNDSYAQRKAVGMPDDGYWVIESNVKTPRQSTVYFYTRSQQLIGQQQFSGKKLNVSRRKVVKELNGLLYQSLVAWNKKEEDKNASMLAKKE